MNDEGWITVHFPGDNVPIEIRKSSIVAYHQAPDGTNVMLSSGRGIICLESPDEIRDLLIKEGNG